MRQQLGIVWMFAVAMSCLGTGAAMGQPGLRALAPSNGNNYSEMEAGRRKPKSKLGFFNRALRSVGYGWSDGYHADNRQSPPSPRHVYPLYPSDHEPIENRSVESAEADDSKVPVLEITPPSSSITPDGRPPKPTPSPNIFLPQSPTAPSLPAIEASEPAIEDSEPASTPRKRYPLNQTALPKLQLH